MGDEEQATLDGQFFEYAKLLDNKRDGTTITLYRSDFWMRQAKMLDDRKVTMTDTGILFNKFRKTELTFDEWMEFIGDLCEYKDLDREKTEELLTNCGLPGQIPVVVPQYRDFFLTYTPKDKMVCPTAGHGTPFIMKGGKAIRWPSAGLQTSHTYENYSENSQTQKVFGKASGQCTNIKLKQTYQGDGERHAIVNGMGFSQFNVKIYQILQYLNLTRHGIQYCAPAFDTYLCWPPTPAGEEAYQNCPSAPFSDTTRTAYRRCGRDGLWLNRRPIETNPIGWTNYTTCFPKEVRTLLEMVYHNEKEGQLKLEIAQRTRYLEIAGFSTSLVALILSLIIFRYYRFLRNKRTRIHECLFIAMVGQVVIRLILYIDQARVRNYEDTNSTLTGIDNVPYLCESTYVLLEYGITSMFMWMLMEGINLHGSVTNAMNVARMSYRINSILGWVVPAVVTSIWAAATAIHYQKENVKRCWYGYNFSKLYWITQGPRLAVIIINMLFLTNIMRVLIVKLQRSQSTELMKMRTAVRAALVLLPLLGITNGLNMINEPLDRSVWVFALWSYTTHFLRAFQGFFIALIYCFLNGEVRYVLKKHYQDLKDARINITRRRCSSPNQFGVAVEEIPLAETKQEPYVFETMKCIKPRSNYATKYSDDEMESDPTDSQEQTKQEPYVFQTMKCIKTRSYYVPNHSDDETESDTAESPKQTKQEPVLFETMKPRPCCATIYIDDETESDTEESPKQTKQEPVLFETKNFIKRRSYAPIYIDDETESDNEEPPKQHFEAESSTEAGNTSSQESLYYDAYSTFTYSEVFSMEV